MKMKLATLTPAILIASMSQLSAAQTYTPQIDSDYMIYPQEGTTIDAAEVIVNKSYFYKPIYRLGHGLGFAWAGQKGYHKSVGYGIKRTKTASDSYHLEPKVLSGVNHGPHPDDRLEVDIENIKFTINGEDLLLGDAEIVSSEPKAYQKAVMYNCDPNHTDEARSVVTHTESSEWNKSSSHGVSADVGVSQAFEVKAEIPFVETSTTTTFSASFGTDHSWTSTNGGKEEINFQQDYSTTIPPRSKKVVNLNYFKTKARIPYSNKQIMSYDITYRGFLRDHYNMSKEFPSYLDIVKYPLYNDWTDNAYRGRDISKYEVFNYTFGQGSKTAQQDIYSQYVNDLGGILNSSKWNWEKYISSSVRSLGMKCLADYPCSNDRETWDRYGNQPLAEVLRRFGVIEEGYFEVDTAGLFHVVSGEALPMTADEIATQCSSGYQGTRVKLK
ncbi:aerolysin family beta-barrel pore-forming toxin [Vibrio coralliilyticus]|uniref:aerolysin family beta-barrel pore-forming toxin n=1 Tax=Vibrio coralliilyticus TaxID=190893 RepID=UPI001E620D90|nr:aerolysin family beta-barrel pore-forming toxin [Vibrio coralliilyticus]MCC2525779.1 aerolysin family beta-barrel pore-forming toxin [Vibrio coralliilyticus]